MTARVVFDTGVLLSGIVFGGKPRECIFATFSGRLSGIVCDGIIQEVADKLGNKFGYAQPEIEKILTDLRTHMEAVQIGGDLTGICADPKDDMLLECAVVAQADYVVSGDRKHLVSLGSYQGIQIVEPATLLSIVGTAQVS